MLDALDAIVLPFLESLYASVGYAGVVIAMTIESCAIPLPSELILPFAGWSVSRGVIEPVTNVPWNYWGAVAAGVAGNTLGSLASYAIGAYGGRPLVERYGRYVLLGAHDLELADRWFARWGRQTVFWARLLPVVRTFIALPAGIAKMELWPFVWLTFAGSLPWCWALAYAGVRLAENWNRVRDAMHGFDVTVGLAVAALFALALWHRIRAIRAAARHRAAL